MERLEYEIEFITPAFIGGADKKAELRPASFIGLLRWWWRVILASFLNSPEDIYKWEGKLFGTQDKAGSIFLRIKSSKESSEISEGLNTYPYLLGLGGRNRNFIKPGTVFKLELIVPDTYKEIVNDLVQLAINFGGIGYRGRKGFGSMKLIDNKVNHNILNAEYWSKHLRRLGLKEATYTSEIPNLKNLILLKYDYKIGKNWEQAVNKLGEIYRKIKRAGGNKTPEYNSCIYFFLRGLSLDIKDVKLANLPFGLPVMFQSRSLYISYGSKLNKEKKEHAKAQLNWKLPSSKEDDYYGGRRASSILFNVKEYGIYALAFRCKFLPENSNLVIKAEGNYWKLQNKQKPKPISLNLSNGEYLNIFDQVIQRLKNEGFSEVKICTS